MAWTYGPDKGNSRIIFADATGNMIDFVEE